jgi:hypothetical protein
MVRKWRKAATFTHFEPPVSTPTTNTGNRWRFYTNYQVLGPMEEMLEAQNENLGPDVAKYDGAVMFRRTPVEWVPKLEADTTGPIYGINWGTFKLIVLKDWWLRETNVPVYPGQHTVQAHFLDSTYQFVSKSRRDNFVLATGTTEPS